MEDEASGHRAAYTRQIREEYGIPKFDWPRSSPDLNLIENVGYILKDNLNKRPARPQDKKEMRRPLRRNGKESLMFIS